MSLLNSIRRDIKAARERDPAATNNLEIILAYPGFHARQLHRLAYTLRQRGVPVLPRVISHFNRLVTGIEIHPGAKIADGLFIDHGMGVVIGETTEIGENCHLYQGVTLGGTSTKRDKRHPTLEANVSVGAGAKLIGAITVGENASIGAGSVVVTNVPPNATVVGVPGHIVSYRDPGSDTLLHLPDPEGDRITTLEQQVDNLTEEVRALQKRLESPSKPASNASRAGKKSAASDERTPSQASAGQGSASQSSSASQASEGEDQHDAEAL